MAAKLPGSESLLAHIHALIAARKTNPYQIAKATGIALNSVQKLVDAEYNPTLANAELILRGLGYKITITRDGEPTIQPGTGRGHGKQVGKRRGRG